MKKVTIVSVLAGVAFTILMSGLISSGLELGDTWNLLPDVWDNAVIAGLLALIVSIWAPRHMSRDVWLYGGGIPLILLFIHLLEVSPWTWNDLALSLILTAAVVLHGPYLANQWFGERPPAANTSVPPTGASYDGPPHGH